MTLDANRLMKLGILRAGAGAGGVIRSGESAFRFLVTVGAEAGRLALLYGVDGQAVVQNIDLQASHPPLGGLRWWFTCPESGCGRRVAKLHLPLSGFRFACRSCHRLTYANSQKSHTLDPLYAEFAAEFEPGWTVSLMRRHAEHCLGLGRKFGRKRLARLERDKIQAARASGTIPAEQ